MDFKNSIAEMISQAIKIDKELIIVNIEVPKEKNNGDFSFPCFKLAKELKKSPIEIANEIKDNIVIDDSIISKVEVLNGFLNFYLNKEAIVKEVVEKFSVKGNNYGFSEDGKGKTILVEYSSPTIAKPFHIGHLKTTIIGHALYNMYKSQGYNTISINHLGDYGTQFAKLIEGYKRWSSEYDFSENAIDKLADIYKRINEVCEQDESVLEQCRDTFKKLENGDPYCVEIWNKFKELSLIEFNRIYDLLGIKFDSYRGESEYAKTMNQVIELLEKNGKLQESNGARIVDLSEEGIDTPCIIEKANGSSIYATRDLEAIRYRAKTYDFDKCLYVVGVEQSLHLKQVFEVAKYLDIDKKYIDGLEHVAYGLIRLPEGKMSSRKGNFVKVEDLLNEAVSKVQDVMQDRDVDNKETIVKQVGIGAVVFDYLKESRIKDQVFDINAALNFNGETGPYTQYMAVRTKSIIDKAGYVPNDINYEKISDEQSIEILKQISRYEDIILYAIEKNEPSIITRYVVDLAQLFSAYYNQNKIICDEKELQDARLYLTHMVNVVLTNGLNLLGIEVPEKM